MHSMEVYLTVSMRKDRLTVSMPGVGYLTIVHTEYLHVQDPLMSCFIECQH